LASAATKSFFLRIEEIVQDFLKKINWFFLSSRFLRFSSDCTKRHKGEEGRVEVGIIKCVSWGQEPQLKVYEKTIEQFATTQTT
jgi:hypothetical protein